MLPDGAPQALGLLPESTAPEDERHARLLERMRARLPHAHHVPWGPPVAVGIPVALNVFEINCEGPPAYPVGRPIQSVFVEGAPYSITSNIEICVYDMEEVD